MYTISVKLLQVLITEMTKHVILAHAQLLLLFVPL